MPEYRGIVNPADVKATPMFDWNAVIQDVQKSVTESEATRQANRDKLAKDTNESLTAMEKITLGGDAAVNEKLTNAAYGYKKFIGEQAALVRAGKLAQKDFNMINQNANDAFNQIDAVGKLSKQAYDSYLSETKAGNLSSASDFMAQTLGLAASLKDREFAPDPKTGRGFIVNKNDPKDVLAINTLTNPRNLLIPKVKMDAIFDAQADKIGKFAKMGRVGAGGIWVIEDQTARKGFEDYEQNVANGINTDPMGQLSVLADYSTTADGKKFIPTLDPNNTDPSKIYMKQMKDGSLVPQFTTEQTKIADATAKRYLRERLDYVQSQVQNAAAPREPRAAAAGKKETPPPTVNDIIYSSSVARGGKLQNQQKFIVKVPVVEQSAGVKRSLKEMVYDPTTRNLRIVVDVADAKNPNKVTQVEFSNFSKKKTVKGKLGGVNTIENIKPNISEINRFATKIFDESTGEFLKNQEEWMDWLDKKAVKQDVPVKAPVKDDVVDGYKFLGGDASNEKNWVKI